jgi:hypothetical protein
MNKKVARIIIGTDSNRYLLTIPNLDHEQAKTLIQEAKDRSSEGAPVAMGIIMKQHALVFEFENERLEIDENPLFIHQYIKEENYAFDTPTIAVHVR